MEKIIKKWTILNYANGNNELEPEIYSAFLKIKNEIIDESINVITQVSRAREDLVKALRTDISIGESNRWHGIRRYSTVKGEDKLIEKLENKNMADPKTLYDFINWGIENYPADNIMLILSGHGAGFAGIMTDLSCGSPYIMPIEGVCSAIYNSKEKTQKNIDCVLLDTCYMNLIEVWNEIASIPNKPVKHLIAPSQNIPITGISYEIIIKYLQSQYRNTEDIKTILTESVRKYNEKDPYNQLLSVNLIEYDFNKLKRDVDDLSLRYIKENTQLIDNVRKDLYEPIVNILYLENLIKQNDELEIMETLKNIIENSEILQSMDTMYKGPSLYLPNDLEQYNPVKAYYREMLFSTKDRWLNIVESRYKERYYEDQEKARDYKKMPIPRDIPIENVVSVMLEQNPKLTPKEAYEIVTNRLVHS